MNAFIEHHQPAIRFDYSCFDRILLNGVIQVLQNPACVVGLLKEKRQALSADLLLSMSDYIAPTLMSLAARAVHRQPFVNLIVTNVPGPQQPLYMMGGRLMESYPIVPLTQNLTIVVGILSYDGTLHFGLWADRDHSGDLELLAGGIEDAFAEMTKLATEQGA